ncbi:MAG: phosphonate metabolism transcriptional regulator PhnF [Rhodovulum sp.]
MRRVNGQWRAVRDRLLAQLAEGGAAPGDRLPTETELCAAFGVGRHSVRRAVASLAAEGILEVVQGSGAFVAPPARLSYRIGPRTRFSQNLLADGRTPAMEMLSITTLPAPAPVAVTLGLPRGAAVHALLELGLADGLPLLLARSWYPATLLPDLPERRRAGATPSNVYAAGGFADYHRRDTAITGRRATTEEARHLRIAEEVPVLLVTKTDVSADGRPIGHATTIWPAERVAFTIDQGEPT